MTDKPILEVVTDEKQDYVAALMAVNERLRQAWEQGYEAPPDISLAWTPKHASLSAWYRLILFSLVFSSIRLALALYFRE